MLNIDFTFLWTAVNLALLYLIVRKFLFGRLSKFMNERSQSISDDIEEGRSLREKSEADKVKYEKLLSDAEKRYEQLMEKASISIEKERDSILKDAKKEAALIISNARQKAILQEQKMMDEMRDKAASLALAAASKVIEANMNNEKNRAIVDDFLKREGVA